MEKAEIIDKVKPVSYDIVKAIKHWENTEKVVGIG